MKTRAAILSGIAAVLFAGCVVTSVCPYYTPKDLVFEPAILGTWINQKSDNETWRFEKSGELAYRFTMIESQKATLMEAHAFKLQGQLFLDIFSLEQDIHVIPAHYLLKVTELGPALKLSDLNQDWLVDLVSKNPKAVRHHFIKTGDKPEDRRVVLLADTTELQAFILTHLKVEEAWSDKFDLRREPAPIQTARTKGEL